jgi:hypothetical protein
MSKAAVKTLCLALVALALPALFVGWTKSAITKEQAHLVTQKELEARQKLNDVQWDNIRGHLSENAVRLDEVIRTLDVVRETVARLDERSKRIERPGNFPIFNPNASTKGTK